MERGVALSDSTSRVEGGRSFTIDNDGEVSGGDALMDESNEMIVKTQSSQSIYNEIPLNTVKGFGKVKFQQKGFLVPRGEIEGVDNLLGNDDVTSNMSALHKSCLGRMYEMRQDGKWLLSLSAKDLAIIL